MADENFTSRRLSITRALAEQLKQINGTGAFYSDLANNVHDRLKFWDEIDEYPAIHMAPGLERRVYQGGGYKDRYLSITIRCYVKDEDSLLALEKLLTDVETIIEENGRLAYHNPSGAVEFTHDILIESIETDEGILSPIGAGEIVLQVRY